MVAYLLCKKVTFHQKVSFSEVKMATVFAYEKHNHFSAYEIDDKRVKDVYLYLNEVKLNR